MLPRVEERELVGLLGGMSSGASSAEQDHAEHDAEPDARLRAAEQEHEPARELQPAAASATAASRRGSSSIGCICDMLAASGRAGRGGG